MFRSSPGNRELLLEAKGVGEIIANALELGGPCGEGIRFVVIEHVAHGQAERVEIILHAEELEGILAAAVGQIILQFAKAGNLAGDVPGIGHHGGESDDQAKDQARRGRMSGGARHGMKIQRREWEFQCESLGSESELETKIGRGSPTKTVGGRKAGPYIASKLVPG